MKPPAYAGLAAEMARNGHKAKDLANIIGITESAMSRRLRGQTPFTITEIEKVISFYGKDYNQLFMQEGAL